MFYDIFEEDHSLHGGVPKEYFDKIDHEFGEWEIAPWEVKIFKNKILGEGAFARVYEAEWKGTKVAAKVYTENSNLYYKELILREFNNMTKLHHPNIVQLFGYISDPFIIIMEYFPNGNLLSQYKKIDFYKKKSIILDILKGLNYLHTRKPDYLMHRDIKPQNILLTNSKTAKIADFGLSRFIHKNSNNDLCNLLFLSNNVGTERYSAPEIMYNNENNDNNYVEFFNSKTNKINLSNTNIKYDYKVDIYSTGILMYELFEGKRYMSKINFFWCPYKYRDIIQKMVDINAENRPCAKDLIYALC